MKEIPNHNQKQFAIIPAITVGSQEKAVIECLKNVKIALKDKKEIEEIKEIWQTVNALEAISKQFKLSKELQLDVTELKIRIERRIGELLKIVEKEEKVKKKTALNDSFSDAHSNLSLSNFDFTKNELSNFQYLANTPADKFEAIITDLRIEAAITRKTILSTKNIIRAIKKTREKNNHPLFSSIIKPSDNWNFSTIQYGRFNEEKINQKSDQSKGYIPGEIYANCFWYYVKVGDLVVAPMAGSGQVWRVYEARQEWMGQHAYDFELKMFDLTPRGRCKDLIGEHDLTQSFPVSSPDYIIMDVPYYGMAAQQYSDKPEDLANMTLEDWQIAMNKIAKNCAEAQHQGSLCTVISPNYRDVTKGSIVMVTDNIRMWWESAGYALYDKAYSSRRIQQNQTPNMARMNNHAKANRVMLTDITEILTFRRV